MLVAFLARSLTPPFTASSVTLVTSARAVGEDLYTTDAHASTSIAPSGCTSVVWAAAVWVLESVCTAVAPRNSSSSRREPRVR